jgi:hypothetical protein
MSALLDKKDTKIDNDIALIKSLNARQIEIIKK